MISAGQIIRQRRSLLACDGKTSIPAERFYRMLARTMPMPSDAIPWRAAIHFVLFVHRVEGIEPGLYAMARDPDKVETLKGPCTRTSRGSAAGLSRRAAPLLLERGDARALATQVSCRQEIAGEGAFSLGMIAEYQASLVAHGPSFYRRLFWEAGAIGRCSISRPKRPACARPASAATSTTRCTRSSAQGPRLPVAVPLHRRRVRRRPAPHHARALQARAVLIVLRCVPQDFK